MNCPICSEWRYKSLVKVCLICGRPGGLDEVAGLVNDFLRRLELDKVVENMEHQSWPWPEECPNSEGWIENGIPQEVLDMHRKRYPKHARGI